MLFNYFDKFNFVFRKEWYDLPKGKEDNGYFNQISELNQL
jgi:hypothetical protein